MKLTTKYNIGDRLFVPTINRGTCVPHVMGVVIKEFVVEEISTNGEVTTYIFRSEYESRTEPYLFSNLKDAQKYALSMLDDLYKKNKNDILSHKSILA